MWILPDKSKKYFNADEQAKLGVLFDTLLPGDQASGMPNATEANVLGFVNCLLGQDESTYELIETWRVMYRRLLPAIDAECLSRFEKDMSEIGYDDRIEIVAALERGEIKIENEDSARCFGVLWTHCLQGYFCNPRWNGNKNAIAWRWLGYADTAVREGL